jgi:hypothetical protein
MELVNILSNLTQFPSLYNFTFILFGNNGEIRIHVQVFDDEAVKHSKHDIANAMEPLLLAKFKWYHHSFQLPLLEEFYLLDFDQEAVVLQRVFEDVEKEPERITIFTDGDKKFWLPFKKSENFNERFRFITLDEAERRIAKEVYYNTKQILFVNKTMFGKEV